MAMPKKSVIFEYWKDWLGEHCFDWGEPSCWACRIWYDDKYDIKSSDASWSDILKCWDKVPLQRCHIIPKMLGGSDEPSNLFLMCPECHDLAPDTDSQEIFFRWVSEQNWFRRRFEKLETQFKTYELEFDDPEIYGIINSNEFRDAIKSRVGLHGSQKGYGVHFSESSIVGIIWEIKNNRAKKDGKNS